MAQSTQNTGTTLNLMNTGVLTFNSLIGSIAHFIPLLSFFMVTTIFVASSIPLVVYLTYVGGCVIPILFNILFGFKNKLSKSASNIALNETCHVFNIAPVANMTLNKIVSSGLSVVVFNLVYSFMALVTRFRTSLGYFIMNLILTVIYGLYLHSNQCLDRYVYLTIALTVFPWAIGWHLITDSIGSNYNIFSYTDRSSRSKCKKIDGKKKYKCTVMKNGESIAILD